MFKNLSVYNKLLVFALTMGLLPVIVVSFFFLAETKDTLLNETFNHLNSVLEIKKSQVQDFFVERKGDMQVLLNTVHMMHKKAVNKLNSMKNNKKKYIEWYFHEQFEKIAILAHAPSFVTALENFEYAFHKENFDIKGVTWQEAEKKFEQDLLYYKEKLNYFDLYLIAKDGDIVYTANHGSEIGKQVQDKMFNNTGLQQAFEKGKKEITLTDFNAYPLADNRQLGFLSAPLYHHNMNIGVLVLAITPDKITKVMQRKTGLGRSVDHYIVGEIDGKIGYRSQSLLNKTDEIKGKKLRSYIEQALKGKTSTAIYIDEENRVVLISYTPIKIKGVNWAMIATVELKDVLTPHFIGEEQDYFGKYIEQYNYYDLFFIHPDGHIFYTVKHEDDYDTNILTGKYANSNLSQLVWHVLQHKAFHISDYALYQPSFNTPQLFMGQPILNNDEVELIVAVQLNDVALNEIMKQRTGMGETGESYLIGADYLMRSNSFLSPETHSINASFKNPQYGLVKTDSVQQALAGRHGHLQTTNYLNDKVISAFSPIRIQDHTWALIVELHEEEALHELFKLELILIIIMIIAIFIVFVTTRRLTLILLRPLLDINTHLKTLATGALIDAKIKYHYHDEIEEIINSFHQVKLSIANNINHAKAIAQGDYNTHIQLRSRTDELSQALMDMQQALKTAALKSAEQDWLKNGQAQLNEIVSGEQDVVTLSQNIINFIAPYIDAYVGALYIAETVNDETYLQMKASYAYKKRKHLANKFKMGESLVGQAGLEKEVILISKVSEAYIHISSGTGEATPRYIIVIPFLFESELKGVIELGSFSPFNAIQQDFLQQMMRNIGIAINTAESRTTMQDLLRQSQVQTEELQSQSEELQVQTEELQSQQEELRQTNEELELRTHDLEKQKQAVQDKNASLEKTRQTLETKAKELELASKYKSEFLANMSHELRTPLNSLLILAQLLADNKAGNLNEKQVEYARTIHNAGSDLLSLINDILDLSKVEAGKIQIHIEDINLRELIQITEKKFQYLAEEKQLTFRSVLADNLPTMLHTDVQRFKQIVNNLLSNAFKFTQAGEVKLAVWRPSRKKDLAHMHDIDPTKTIAFSVTDSGIGIPDEKQKLIFDAFQQADGTTSRRYGGTGLGLSISRQLARVLGGDIFLDSEEGKGSTFTVYIAERLEISKEVMSQVRTTALLEEKSKKADALPIEIEEVMPAIDIKDNILNENNEEEKIEEIENIPVAINTNIEVEDTQEVVDDRNDLTESDKFILVIEDDENFAKTLSELAHEQGFKCLMAHDGKIGIALTDEYKPHAVILDVGLPEVDGLTVMDHIKNNPDTRHIPVHFISGQTDDQSEARKMGAIGYLLKPVDIADLEAAFSKIEHFISSSVRRVLVIVSDEDKQKEIAQLIEGIDIEVKITPYQDEAYQHLRQQYFDCIVLDIDIEGGQGLRFLELLQMDEQCVQLPIIIYATRNLTDEETSRLEQCEQHLTLKSAYSPERLLDATTLFLHQLQEDLPQEKRDMLRMVHDKNIILKDKTVLVVDDDMRNTFSLVTVLESKEMNVNIAKNGKEALEKLDQNDEIAIVLMDVMMPEMNGYETMQKIREQQRFHRLPIIALTAKAMKKEKSRCLEAGANDYLTKPVDTDKLLALMRIWLYQ